MWEAQSWHVAGLSDIRSLKEAKLQHSQSGVLCITLFLKLLEIPLSCRADIAADPFVGGTDWHAEVYCQVLSWINPTLQWVIGLNKFTPGFPWYVNMSGFPPISPILSWDLTDLPDRLMETARSLKLLNCGDNHLPHDCSQKFKWHDWSRLIIFLKNMFCSLILKGMHRYFVPAGITPQKGQQL